MQRRNLPFAVRLAQRAPSDTSCAHKYVAIAMLMNSKIAFATAFASSKEEAKLKVEVKTKTKKNKKLSKAHALLVFFCIYAHNFVQTFIVELFDYPTSLLETKMDHFKASIGLHRADFASYKYEYRTKRGEESATKQ